MKVNEELFENWTKFKYLRTMPTNQNCITKVPTDSIQEIPATIFFKIVCLKLYRTKVTFAVTQVKV
jgi:hypothetical protein